MDRSIFGASCLGACSDLFFSKRKLKVSYLYKPMKFKLMAIKLHMMFRDADPRPAQILVLSTCKIVRDQFFQKI